MKLKKCSRKNKTTDTILLIKKDTELLDYIQDKNALQYVQNQIAQDKKEIFINLFVRKFWLVIVDDGQDKYQIFNKLRKSAVNVLNSVKKEKNEKIYLEAPDIDAEYVKVFLEAFILASYQFLTYITKDLEKKKLHLKEFKIYHNQITNKDLEEIQNITEAVFIARDLVNTPYADLNSVELAKKIKELGKKAGFKVEVFDKKKIESLKMGGLLAVNKGSNIPPTFSILTYKPSKAKNKKPLILVGKGIVFDTGGLNLKPTGYIEDMKLDMAGAAAVISTIFAIAKLKLPVYVIGLVPSTDNAISNKSYAPGDVLTMFNGMTVEVLNTDAEGRLILADALAYAKKYDPELVIDLATLTGAAQRALGHLASAMLAKTKQETADKLIEAGNKTYERLVQFPLWEEYNEMLKSQIADLKNIGGKEAGLITAAKFLEHFTDYDWIHLDIAPNAFLPENNDFRGKGATGIGVRLLVEFTKNYFGLN